MERHTEEVHSLSEINKPPISNDNAEIVACLQCDFVTRHKDELKKHIQVTHKIVKVNIAKEDHIMIACDQCNFKCRLNIQLKKHLKTSHEVRYKYNCKECAFTANLVADFWKQYSSVHDINAKWPEQNFTDVVNYALKNPGLENYDVLVLSAPTVDITNMDTSKLSPLDNTEIYQQNVIISTQNMFSLAQAALEQNRNLKSVVLMEHTPRFDGLDVDPTSLKPNLVKLANSTLNQLWLNSHLKNKISIGHHSLENSGTETAHLASIRT